MVAVVTVYLVVSDQIQGLPVRTDRHPNAFLDVIDPQFIHFSHEGSRLYVLQYHQRIDLHWIISMHV